MRETQWSFETLIELDDPRVELVESLVQGLGLPAEIRSAVYDLQYEVTYAKEAAETIGFTDDHPLAGVLAVSPFTTQIRLWGERLLAGEAGPRLSFWGAVEPLVSDRIAAEVSRTLSCRAIVMFNDGTTPLRLYSKGAVAQRFCDPPTSSDRSTRFSSGIAARATGTHESPGQATRSMKMPSRGKNIPCHLPWSRQRRSKSGTPCTSRSI